MAQAEVRRAFKEECGWTRRDELTQKERRKERALVNTHRSREESSIDKERELERTSSVGGHQGAFVNYNSDQTAPDLDSLPTSHFITLATRAFHDLALPTSLT